MGRHRVAFFRDRCARTVQAAGTVLDAVLPALPRIASAMDIGCSVGTQPAPLADSVLFPAATPPHEATAP